VVCGFGAQWLFENVTVTMAVAHVRVGRGHIRYIQVLGSTVGPGSTLVSI
jgi:hypothetical protein